LRLSIQDKKQKDENVEAEGQNKCYFRGEVKRFLMGLHSRKESGQAIADLCCPFPKDHFVAGLKSMKPSIILFDGCCNLCSGLVQFILKRKRKDRFRFISLQSEKGKELLKKYDVPAEIDSVVLIENEKYYVRSEAILRIFKRLGGFWKLFWFLKVLPKKLNDVIYEFVSKNRFKWFGRRESCVINEIE
jgi:predicted DCC family thiol-disulfide oxidoreductase YuxK